MARLMFQVKGGFYAAAPAAFAAVLERQFNLFDRSFSYSLRNADDSNPKADAA